MEPDVQIFSCVDATLSKSFIQKLNNNGLEIEQLLQEVENHGVEIHFAKGSYVISGTLSQINDAYTHLNYKLSQNEDVLPLLALSEDLDASEQNSYDTTNVGVDLGETSDEADMRAHAEFSWTNVISLTQKNSNVDNVDVICNLDEMKMYKTEANSKVDSLEESNENSANTGRMVHAHVEDAYDNDAIFRSNKLTSNTPEDNQDRSEPWLSRVVQAHDVSSDMKVVIKGTTKSAKMEPASTLDTEKNTDMSHLKGAMKTDKSADMSSSKRIPCMPFSHEFLKQSDLEGRKGNILKKTMPVHTHRTKDAFNAYTLNTKETLKEISTAPLVKEFDIDENIWNFIEEKKADILNNIRQLGASFDKFDGDGDVSKIIVTRDLDCTDDIVEVVFEQLIQLYNETVKDNVVETLQIKSNYSTKGVQKVFDICALDFPEVYVRKCMDDNTIVFIGPPRETHRAKHCFEKTLKILASGNAFTVPPPILRSVTKSTLPKRLTGPVHPNTSSDDDSDHDVLYDQKTTFGIKIKRRSQDSIVDVKHLEHKHDRQYTNASDFAGFLDEDTNPVVEELDNKVTNFRIKKEISPKSVQRMETRQPEPSAIVLDQRAAGVAHQESSPSNEPISNVIEKTFKTKALDVNITNEGDDHDDGITNRKLPKTVTTTVNKKTVKIIRSRVPYAHDTDMPKEENDRTKIINQPTSMTSKSYARDDSPKVLSNPLEPKHAKEVEQNKREDVKYRPICSNEKYVKDSCSRDKRTFPKQVKMPFDSSTEEEDSN